MHPSNRCMHQAENCTVKQSESGQKLLSFLRRKLGRSFPPSALMRLIRTGQVRVNKGRCKPFDRVFTDDTVRIPPCFKTPDAVPDCSGQIDIVYETENFLALNKPRSLPVHPGTDHRDSLVCRVLASCPDNGFTPTPVHRLDKNTTGLILFAKSYTWLIEMQNMWNSRAVRKTYLTWVKGSWQGGSGQLKDRLYRQQDKVRVNHQGKQSSSRVTPISVWQDMSLLQVQLNTGRKHQIRVQLAARGHPVVGDTKYGGEHTGSNMMFLHCFEISWPEHSLTVAPDWSGKFSIPSGVNSGQERNP